MGIFRAMKEMKKEITDTIRKEATELKADRVALSEAKRQAKRKGREQYRKELGKRIVAETKNKANVEAQYGGRLTKLGKGLYKGLQAHKKRRIINENIEAQTELIKAKAAKARGETRGNSNVPPMFR